LQSRIAKIEKEMDALHAEKTALDHFVADPASYEASMKTRLTDSIRRQADVSARLETLELEWLEVHEELEQIG
jgi:ATP-binding cassette subfamily F protein 3